MSADILDLHPDKGPLLDHFNAIGKQGARLRNLLDEFPNRALFNPRAIIHASSPRDMESVRAALQAANDVLAMISRREGSAS